MTRAYACGECCVFVAAHRLEGGVCDWCRGTAPRFVLNRITMPPLALGPLGNLTLRRAFRTAMGLPV